ncbi:MAG TPA: chemotaxis protein CheD [Sedimentisphaerales bacterium]|nr:chemotaxis protein CheD [Sedimentisphaerales bacterium]
MKRIIDVNTGEVKVAGKNTLLRSVAIGSCIAVVAYDAGRKIGAMAHVMLPGRAPKKAEQKNKYAADAIEEMLSRMKRAGADTDNIEVCLVGAGNVLGKKDDTICKQNIESTTGLLEREHIPVRGRVLGGTKRKGIFLDVETGSVSYTEGDEKEKPLYEWTSGRNTDGVIPF